MGELVVDVARVWESLSVIGAVGRQVDLHRAPPSISMCGSDAVIDSFVQAFWMVEQQDVNVWSGWADLAQRTVGGLVELAEVDASLAVAFE